MHAFCSLSLRTFDKILLEFSSTVTRCFQRHFTKTETKFAPFSRPVQKFSTKSVIFACGTQNFIVWFAKIEHIDQPFSFVNNCGHFRDQYSGDS